MTTTAEDLITKIVLGTVTVQDFYNFSRDWNSIIQLISSSEGTLQSFGFQWDKIYAPSYFLKRNRNKVLLLMETRNTISPYLVVLY